MPPADTRVVRIRRSATIADPQIKALILRAVEATRYPGTTPAALYDAIAADISADTLGIFVGCDEEGPVALAAATLPTNPTMLAPQCFLVYSDGKPHVIRMMGERVRAWIMGAGYDRVLGINLRHADKAFCRALARYGTPRVIASVVEVRF